MLPDRRLRSFTDRLARLLTDERGAQVLAELQRLTAAHRTAEPAAEPAEPEGGSSHVGVWATERTGSGVALHRRDVRWQELIGWSDIPSVPPAGNARRVVLIGESSARGLDAPGVLQGQLDRAAPGGYQCVNLLKTGGSVEELIRLTDQLPRAEPDIVVVVGGNDWTGPPTGSWWELSDRLARSWADGGYPAVRRAFIDDVVLPRARRFLDRLVALNAEHGTRIVVMVPEFNLPGWAPPADVEVPVLPPDALARWCELRDEAVRATEERRWPDVAPAVEQMRLLDGGTSPIPGYLLAGAAIAQGDGKTARAGLEGSRDALVGLGVWHTPRILREIQELLAGFAREQGFRCVDLRAVLASDELPEMPDIRYLYSYCHLSDEGMELAMAAIADAVLDVPQGTTAPGQGVDPTMRAAAHLTAAVFGALFGNPSHLVRPLLRNAIEADAQAGPFLETLLEVLEGAGPLWSNAGIQRLAGSPLAATLFGPQLMKNTHPPELWTLRECLGEILGRTPAAVPAEVDLLDAPDGPGHRPANLSAPRCYRQATAQRQALPFALDRPRGAVLRLTYRTPHAPPGTAATVTLNDTPVGTLPASGAWTGARLDVPADAARAGVNWLQVRWPVPAVDPDEWHAAEAAALTRGAPLAVLPVFGELFEARLSVEGAPS